MTDDQFRAILTAIDRQAEAEGVDFADPANIVTVWLDWMGTGKYEFHGAATGLAHAQMLAGRRQAIIRTTEAGRIQIYTWKDQRIVDSYSDWDHGPSILNV